jgi:hypothetical protein
MGSTILGVLWSLTLALSCIGLGGIIPSKNHRMWYSGSLGICVLILSGGILDCLHLAYPNSLLIIALLGLPLGITRVKNWIKRTHFNYGVFPLLLITLIVVSIGCISLQLLANWDDVTGYSPVCHELRESGNSWAPFSLRRACTLGGQFPLQSLGMLITGDQGWAIYEVGITGFLFLLLVIEEGLTIGVSILLGATILILPEYNTSSAPNVIITLLVLTFIYTKEWVNKALLIATIISMRITAIPYLTLLMGLIFLQSVKTHGIKSTSKDIIKIALLSLLFLIPFSINHYSQFKTYCLVLGPGTVDPKWATCKGDFNDAKAALLELIKNGWLIITCLVLIVLFNRKRYKEALAALGALIISTYMLSEYSHIEWIRYSYPYIVSAIIITMLDKVKDNITLSSTPLRRSRIENFIQWILIILLCTSIVKYPYSMYERRINKIIKEKKLSKDTLEYSKMAQDTIPEGATILLLDNQANIYDFHRNKILNMDAFPSIGTYPKTCKESTYEAWRSWAKKNKIDYFIHLDFYAKRCGITAKENFISPKDPELQLKNYKRVVYPAREKFIDGVTELDKTSPKEDIWHVAELVIIKF